MQGLHGRILIGKNVSEHSRFCGYDWSWDGTKERHIERVQVFHPSAVINLKKALEQRNGHVRARLEQVYRIDASLDETTDQIAIGGDQSSRCRDSADATG